MPQLERPSLPYTRFSPEENFENLDYIIVGSGIGGLTTAVFLAKAGKKVLVLERHIQPGGFSHTFERAGFVWDVGVHYVGQMSSENSFLRKVFDYVSDNQLDWASVGEIYDTVIIGNDQYQFPTGEENLRKELHKNFPKEKPAIDRYLKLSRKVSRLSGLYFAEKAFPRIISKLAGSIFRWPFLKYASRTTGDVIGQITNNKRLQAVLCAQFGNYGLSPQHSSFGVHAIIARHFMDGGYYPVGGASQISSSMIKCLEKHGGMIRVGADVSEICLNLGKVNGIKIKEKFIPCPNVISNMGASLTLDKLPASLKTKTLPFNLKNINSSTCHFCLYLGLEHNQQEIELPRHNIWYYDHHNFNELAKNSLKELQDPLSFAYISFPSEKDPQWQQEHPGKTTIQAIGIANYEWFKDFENQPRRQRDEGYNELKEKFKNNMLDLIGRLFPDLKNHITHCEVSTPLSTRHYMNTQHGEIYGLEHTPERMQEKSLRPETSLPGLYLVGQDTTMVGVASALLSALLTSSTILKFSIARHFREMHTLQARK
ncbi:MAG: NAD(P)/FAD-dependent oxidoreductase [Planctomycetes bacterium]|nr:NAD(P)/FAD-dependent oxidoreductase [Planctomycetota bacterium]